MPLDPHVSRFLDMMALGASGGITLAARREGLRGLTRLAGLSGEGVATRELSLPGPAGALSARLYVPEGTQDGPGLLYLHGGGLVTGDLDSHDGICRVLAEAGSLRVVALDYRLAPEHPFPAALDDALAATAWVAANAKDLGIDPDRLGIGGDSAGAGLAARVCQERRGGGIAAQLLICPVLDVQGTSASRRDFARGYFLDAATIRGDLAACGPEAAAPSARLSPLREADLADLPPAQIHTAEYDPVRDEGGAYAERLTRAGGEAAHTCHPGMIHFFYGLGRLVPRSRPILSGIARDFAALLGAASPSPVSEERAMSLRTTVFAEIAAIAAEQEKRMPPITDDLVMLDTEFDSLCFALLVARMEDLTGADPFGEMDASDLPVTVGDLVALYDRAAIRQAA